MVKQKISGNLLVSIAALLWGTSFVAIEWGFRESNIDPLVFVFLRFGIATLIFLPFSLLFIKEKKKLLMRKEIILIGLFNAFSFLFQFLGQQYTTAGKASLFVNFYAITVPLIAPLILPEKYSWKVIVGAVLGFAGAFLVTTNLDFTDLKIGGTLTGDLLTLASGGAWTVYILASKKFLEKEKQISGLDTFFGTIVWTTVFLTIAVPFTFINNTWTTVIAEFNWQVIVSVFYLAIVCTVGAFAIYMIGLKKAEAGESVIYMFLEVIIAFLLGWILFETVPEIWESIGAAMILLAIIVVSIKFKKIKERSSENEVLENNVEKT
jgi:drug/metabolite transporter (DMT)-like permease